DGPVFAKDSKIVEVWVDGRPYEVNAPTGSARGEWTVTLEPPTAIDVKIIVGKAERVRVSAGPGGKRARESHVTRDRITIVTDAAIAPSAVGLSTWTGMIEGETMTGTGILANGEPFRWKAARVPGSETRPSNEREGPDDRPASRPDSRPEEERPPN